MLSWTLLGFGATQVLRLGSNLLLTRLLAPESFGVMSLGYALVIAIAMLSDMSVEPALVQRRAALTPRFVNTLWSVQASHGVAVGALMLVFAALAWLGQIRGFWPSAAVSTFASSELPGVLALLAFSPIATGLISTNYYIATREMNIARTAMLQLAESLLATAVTLTLAFWLRTVYALPIGVVAGNLFRTWVSHAMLPGERNRWCWDKEVLSELRQFGKWLLLSTAMTFAVNGGDRLLLGSFLTSRDMGLYAIAFLLASTAQGLLQKLNTVGLPLFSEVARERPFELPAIFHKIRLPVDLVSLFAAGAMAGAAPLIVGVMYDARYAGSADMLVALSLIVAAARYDLLGACWTALGITKRLTVLSFVRMLCVALGMPLGYHLGGAVGAAWGVGLAAMSNHPIGWWFMHRSGLLNLSKELRVLPAAFVGYALGWLTTTLWR